jgi:hypothetical protein
MRWYRWEWTIVVVVDCGGGGCVLVLLLVVVVRERGSSIDGFFVIGFELMGIDFDEIWT